MTTDADYSATLNPGRMVLAKCCTPCHPPRTTGSAFAGLSASWFWNCLLAFCMFVGRFGVIIPVMALPLAVNKRAKPPAPARRQSRPAVCCLLMGTPGCRLVIYLYPCPGALSGGGYSPYDIE
ncbi:potassium-transporting ATPase subunit KdpA [Escherichia coli]